MQFVGLGAEIPKRPALVRYWRAMQARPSFSIADIWTKFHVFRLIGGILGVAR
jgi:tetrachloro-p-hydroquinone reductive dehalogenase